jgi:hypothetical protein
MSGSYYDAPSKRWSEYADVVRARQLHYLREKERRASRVCPECGATGTLLRGARRGFDGDHETYDFCGAYGCGYEMP